MVSIASPKHALVIACGLAGCVEAPSGPSVRSDAHADGARPSDEPSSSANLAPQFVRAEAGDVIELVQRAVEAARQDDRTLVVYVGATWCEPCEAFHRAVERGELDSALAGVRLLEFDADQDGPRLDAAGYSGQYVPRFTVPTDDGRPSGYSVEGGIKGEGAVEHIMKRLGPVLARLPGA